MTMSKVFVLDTNKQPLNPVHAGRARLLLKQGKAAIYRRYPFSIILKRAVEQPDLHPLRVKVDPGSQTTGLAVVNEASGEVVWAAELTHRGQQVKRALESRRGARSSRRQRKTRYRKPRFDNRRKKKGTLPPSLESRISNMVTWVRRLLRLCPVSAISQELVKFDLQQMEQPDISGVQYQQGTLFGYEVREYVLLKWQHRCASCDARCNQRKSNQDVDEFLKDGPARLARILAHLKAPLKDAEAVNATRWALNARLRALGLPVECGSGGLTKYNRVRRGLPKTHWLDAACIGRSTPEHLNVKGVMPLQIMATGHGSRQMCNVDRFGFPCSKPKGAKRVQGFQTGDLVRAVVTSGTKQRKEAAFPPST
jgi:hypothetical protein